MNVDELIKQISILNYNDFEILREAVEDTHLEYLEIQRVEYMNSCITSFKKHYNSYIGMDISIKKISNFKYELHFDGFF